MNNNYYYNIYYATYPLKKENCNNNKLDILKNKKQLKTMSKINTYYYSTIIIINYDTFSANAVVLVLVCPISNGRRCRNALGPKAFVKMSASMSSVGQ